MLVDGRRFDIRQLVLVAGFDPLEVFAYDDFYVRICAKDYKAETAEGDLFASLANNSISKNSSEPKLHHENMMFMDELDRYMKQADNDSAGIDGLKQQMHHVIKTALLATRA